MNNKFESAQLLMEAPKGLTEKQIKQYESFIEKLQAPRNMLVGFKTVTINQLKTYV